MAVAKVGGLGGEDIECERTRKKGKLLLTQEHRRERGEGEERGRESKRAKSSIHRRVDACENGRRVEEERRQQLTKKPVGERPREEKRQIEWERLCTRFASRCKCNYSCTVKGVE